MDRNPNDNFGTSSFGEGGTSGTTGGAGFAGTTGTTGTTGTPGTTGTGFDQTGTSGAGTTGGTQDTGGRVQHAKEVVRDKLGTVRERAESLQATLADKLEAGADKLRQRSTQGELAAAGTAGTAGTSVGMGQNDRMTRVQDSVATGLSSTADWLRNGDLKADIERQVRDHPGRTLLIAAGIGYLLGKSFRR